MYETFLSTTQSSCTLSSVRDHSSKLWIARTRWAFAMLIQVTSCMLMRRSCTRCGRPCFIQINGSSCGALFDPWNIQDYRAVGVGLEEILTGELQAELTLFREPGRWLIMARNGSGNGSNTGLSRVTWRRKGSMEVIRDSERTQNAVNPRHIAEAISQPVNKGPVTRDRLKRMPSPVISDSDLKPPPGETGFKNYNELERNTTKLLRKLGPMLKRIFTARC